MLLTNNVREDLNLWTSVLQWVLPTRSAPQRDSWYLFFVVASTLLCRGFFPLLQYSCSYNRILEHFNTIWLTESAYSQKGFFVSRFLSHKIAHCITDRAKAVIYTKTREKKMSLNLSLMEFGLAVGAQSQAHFMFRFPPGPTCPAPTAPSHTGLSCSWLSQLPSALAGPFLERHWG